MAPDSSLSMFLVMTAALAQWSWSCRVREAVALGLRARWRSGDHLHKTQDRQDKLPQTRARHAQARASMTQVQWPQAGEVHACTVPVQVQHPRSWPLLSTLSRGWLNPLCEARTFSARVLSIICPDMSSAVATAYACLAPGCACLPVLFLKIRQFRGHVRSALAWPCAARTKAHASKASCASPFQAAASRSAAWEADCSLSLPSLSRCVLALTRQCVVSQFSIFWKHP